MVERGFMFLDEGLRLDRFTDWAAAILGFSGQNIGESVTQLSSRLVDVSLGHEAQRVLAGEEIVEHEVRSEEGRWIRVAFEPYRSFGADGGGSTGVVVTLTDVTGARTARSIPALRLGHGDGSEGEATADEGRGESALDLGNVAPPLHEQGRTSPPPGSSVQAGESVRVSVLERRIEEQAHEIRRLNREVSLAERNERDRIARILHDEFQQILYALKIRIGAVLGGASIGVHGGAIRELMEQATVLTRTLVGSLAPPIYESDDLIASLDWLADYVGDRFGVQVEVSYDEPLPTCNEERRVLLFEAVREFLFNVVKHAGTDRARVTVRGEAGHITAVVEDEGQGFDATAAGELSDGGDWNDELPEGGYGLAQIRRCLHLIGGWLTVESAPGTGTRASAAVPLETEGAVSPVG